MNHNSNISFNYLAKLAKELAKAESHGILMGNGEICITLKLARDEIESYLGTAIESVIRDLS